MGKTQHFGLNRFGAEGRISDEGYKFSLRDRDLIDTVLHTLMTHTHGGASVSGLEGPPAGIYLTLTLSTSGGTIPADRDYYYKFSYLDADGNETQASSAVLVSTPEPITAPDTQNLSTASTGGTLEPGTYKYALAFYQDAGGVTTAPNISSITVPQGTSTNTVTVPLPTLPGEADGWKIYRRGPGDLEYWLLTTVASGPTEYVDDGTVSPDCTQKRPLANTTNSTNSIQVDIPASELPLDPQVTGWNIYRSSHPGSYPAKSLVATVVETTTEGGADLVTTYTDTGGALNSGIPLGQTSVPDPPPSLDAGSAFDATGSRLPAALAPQGVQAFNLLLPGTLAAQTYHQFVPPYDMLAERIDGFYLTAPTGLTPSTDYVTVRFSDNASQNEIQALYNDAVTYDEIQTVWNDATSGTFTLSDGVDTTSAINFDALADDIELRLETDITSITDVTVVGSGTANDPWTITFVDPSATNVTQLTADDTNLTGGSSTVTTVREGNDGGTFTLSDGTDTTSAIVYNASAATIETRLQTDITSITDVTVTGTGVFSDPWLIEFVDPGGQDLDLLIVDDGSPNLNGNSFISEEQQGYGNTQLDLIIDQNQQAHTWQSSITDAGSQEAEDAPAVGGVVVSDNLATNDSAAELDAQNENNYWQIGTLEEGSYRFSFWAAVRAAGVTFDLRVNELTSEVQSLFNNSTTGTFTISFDGVGPTNAIAYNAAASTIKTELEALSNITQVSVSGTGVSGDPWLITFDNPAGNVAQITTDDTSMDGSSTIATDTAGTSTVLESLSVANDRLVYTPEYELRYTTDGTKILQVETEKTDAGTDAVRIDKYEYEAEPPTLHGGSTVTVEVLVTGTPTTNGDDLQLSLWY